MSASPIITPNNNQLSIGVCISDLFRRQNSDAAISSFKLALELSVMSNIKLYNHTVEKKATHTMASRNVCSRPKRHVQAIVRLGSSREEKDSRRMGGMSDDDMGGTGGVSVSDVHDQAMGGISDEEDRGGISGSKGNDRRMGGMSDDDTGGVLGSEVGDRAQAMGGTFEPDNTGGVSVSDVCDGLISGSQVEQDFSSSEGESNRKRTCFGSQAVATSPSRAKETQKSYSPSGCLSVRFRGESAQDAQLTKDNMGDDLRKKQDTQLTTKLSGIQSESKKPLTKTQDAQVTDEKQGSKTSGTQSESQTETPLTMKPTTQSSPPGGSLEVPMDLPNSSPEDNTDIGTATTESL